jgi:hypothetical protein
VIVGPDAHIVWRNPSISSNGSRLDDDKAHAADRATAKVHQVKVIRVTVFGRIHAHRRHGNSVPEGDTSDRYRSKEVDLGYFSVVSALRSARATSYLPAEVFDW